MLSCRRFETAFAALALVLVSGLAIVQSLRAVEIAPLDTQICSDSDACSPATPGPDAAICDPGSCTPSDPRCDPSCCQVTCSATSACAALSVKTIENKEADTPNTAQPAISHRVDGNSN